jgi:hypothetical protein
MLLYMVQHWLKKWSKPIKLDAKSDLDLYKFDCKFPYFAPLENV